MRRHWAFLCILLATAVVRFAILVLSQTHVTSDEAIIGLMGKHILEGRAFPFYFYGISYNASCAWEAYLAVLPFAIGGVTVLALKIPTVLLSLICLLVFYMLAARLYSIRVASWAALIFSFWPGLLKWHFQPRGYAFYFLFVPALVVLFLIVEKQNGSRARNFFLFGLLCGIALWGMELLLITIVALWLLLILERRLSIRTFGAGAAGFLLGYAPAICWNLTHSMRNWHFLFVEKPEAGGFAARFGPQAWREIFLNELPKFFNDDTVLWYFPETKWIGYVLYFITVLAIAYATRHALPQIVTAFRSGFSANNATKDLLMLVLIVVSFVPYIIAPLRVPGYFLGATFFMSILLARLIDDLLARQKIFQRAAASAILLAIILCGITAIFDLATHNEIETLTLSANRHDHEMIRIPGADIDAVEQDLEQNQIRAVWTTVSFVYPLIFETKEKLVASESIFGVDRPVYPPSIPKAEPSEQDRAVFVIETKSPFREQIESTLTLKSDARPQIRQHGTLVVIQQRFASEITQ
jgi:4-amino-4-deoxy-L-arabinose transferase-like glycosyltransferase